MQNCVTMQSMLINSSYTFRIMTYSGSDLVRSSVTGSNLGRSGKLTKRPIDGSRGVWPAQRPNEGEKAGSPDKLHRFEWTEQRRDIVRNISILSFLLVSMWFPHKTEICAKNRLMLNLFWPRADRNTSNFEI